MITRTAVLFVFLLAVPAWPQVDTNGAEASPQDQARMLTPPVVNGQAYATVPMAEMRSNYVNAGLVFNTAYTDNVLAGLTPTAISDISYSAWPSVALDETTPRLHSLLTYSPGFTAYERTGGRNEADENVAMDIEYRLSPHVTASLRDSFQKSSNVFNQPDVLAPVYGTPQAATVAVIAPLADRLYNTANAELTYQFSASGMIGVGGMFNNLHYPNPAQVPGLYDSSLRGGSAFYSRRLSRKHYAGALYQYSTILAYPVRSQSELDTHTVFAFYTVYLKPNLSLSLAGGPQYYDATQTSIAPVRSWSPAGSSSLGWQGRRATLAASYSRMMTSGGGLSGAFHMNSANASASWQLARTWDVGVAGSYAIYKTLTPLFVLSNAGGHADLGTVTLRHAINQHFSAQLGYSRLHQSYGRIPVVATNPDTNREFVSISYQFSRPLGR